MTSQPPIILIEQYFFPEGWGGAQIPRDIAMTLATAGHPVSVVCGRDQYVSVATSSIDDPSRDPRTVGVSIWYVPRLLKFKRRSKSVLSQAWFSLFAFALVVFKGRRSILMVQTNPPFIAIAAGAMSALLGRPLVLIAQDIYPEVMIANGMLKEESGLAKILLGMFRWAYKRADYVVSLGPIMTRRLLEKGVEPTRIRRISNWATGDLNVVRGDANSLRAEWGLTGKFVLLYSGNLGVAHDIETVLRALEVARFSLPNLRLVIVGDGSRIAQAKSAAHQLAVADQVIFRPFVAEHQLPLSLGVADLALVSLLPGFEGLVVPSKLLGQMARGIPTAYVGPASSDVAELIADSGGGICVENGKAEDFAAQLIELAANPGALERMGASAMAYYAANLSKEKGLRTYRSVVASISGFQNPT